MRRIFLNSHATHCLVAILFLASTVIAQTSKVGRKASVEDAAGVRTELTGVRYEAVAKDIRGGYGWGRLVVLADPLRFLIDVDEVKSIVKIAGKDSWEIIYVWLDQERKIAGTLAAGEFVGDSDFGQVKIQAAKLRSLIFAHPPAALSDQTKASIAKELNKNRAKIVLANGTELVAGSVKRHFSYYSTEGYIIGGETRYSESSDFSFKRGESLITIEFGKLKSVEFGANDSVTVTLPNGSSASGTVGTGRNGFSGLSAVSDRGRFYVETRFVKRIDFEGKP